jgi:hypothetical protein
VNEAAGSQPLPAANTQKAANDGRIQPRSTPVNVSTHPIERTLGMRKFVARYCPVNYALWQEKKDLAPKIASASTAGPRELPWGHTTDDSFSYFL